MDELRDVAREFARRLQPQELPAEMLRLGGDTWAIITDLDGEDYVLTLQRVPRRRPRGN